MRRNPSDTATEAGDLFRASLPHPPEHVYLPDAARPFWWSVVSAKAADAWSLPILSWPPSLRAQKPTWSECAERLPRKAT